LIGQHELSAEKIAENLAGAARFPAASPTVVGSARGTASRLEPLMLQH
jgi:hypothetical protein